MTPGNIDDRKPVPDLLCGLFGKIFGDTPLASALWAIAAMFLKNLLLNCCKSLESNFLPNPVAT
nr:transposase [Brasilonema sp. UFV-L1]